MWQHCQIIILACGGVAFLSFVVDYTRHKTHKIVIGIGLSYLLCICAGILSRGRLIWSNTPLVKTINGPFDQTIVYNEMAPGPLAKVLSLMAIVVFTYAFYLGYLFFKKTNTQRGKTLMITTGFFFVGVINDAAIAMGFLDSIYVIEYCFIFLIVMMAFVLSDEVIKASILEIAHRESEQNLQQLRDYLRNIVNSMPSVLIGVNAGGRVVQWNTEAEKVTGIPVSTALDKQLPDVFPELNFEMKKVKAAISNRIPVTDQNIPMIRNGETAYTDITVFPLLTDNQTGAVVRIDDVTDRVRIQEMMAQSEKMLSISGLAAGLAHEINNPLAGMLQSTQVIRNRILEDLPKNHDVAEKSGTTLSAIQKYARSRKILQLIDSILESGTRATGIVENTLNFSRKSDSGIEPKSITDLLDYTIELASNDFNLNKHYAFKNIEISREYEDSLPDVWCDALKIQQVFMNIITNGAQAMAEGNKQNGSARFHFRVEREDERVKIEIENNGPHIPDAVRRRIFEPFFTTKSAGHGIGLGLAICYFIIVESHNGLLNVESSAGSGTLFVIQLPIKPMVNPAQKSENIS